MKIETVIRQKKYMFFITLFLIAMLYLLFSVSDVYAGETSNTKVRVGWYELEHFQMGKGKDEIKQGYAYEYLQSVANYTGWEYEYVYGSWADLYEMLIKGEIDILCGVSITSERKELMLFPKGAMGQDEYFIYKRENDFSISRSDVTSLNGKKIGTIRNTFFTDLVVEWEKNNEVSCVTIEYDSLEESQADFLRGDIDCFVAANAYIDDTMTSEPVAKIASSDYYVAVNKAREDLLIELNKAQALIYERNPYFINELQNKYYRNSVHNITLSKEERQWLDENTCLKVGFVTEYLPFCDTNDEGEIDGVITEVFDALVQKLGIENKIQIVYVPFETYEEMMESLQRGIIDVAFPITSSIWMSEQNDIIQTTSVIESSVYIIYKGEYNENTVRERIAISNHSPFQETFVRMNCPDSEIVRVNSAQECLDAVISGKATCTFFNSGRGDKYLSMKEYSLLNSLTYGENAQYCIGIKKGNNTLFSLIERGACVIDKTSMINSMYKYVHTYHVYTVKEFVNDNFALVMIIFLIIILAISIALIFYVEATRKEKKHKKEIEAALEDAKQANRVKTDFLFNMSHDIRTPMNAIIGFTDLIDKNKDNSEKIDEYVKKIQLSNDYLLSLINSVLEMSRIDSGVMKVEETIWDVKEFNDVLYSIFEQDMKTKHISFTRSVNVEHMSVYCDSTKLREIFLNIISNAFKYSKEGGIVHMALEEIPSDDENIALFKTTISDNGIGISKEFIPKIFDEFTRAQSSTDSKIEGTGLGMAITKKLVDILGGSIEVESELGVGTKFTVIIPHRIATEDEKAKEQDEEKEEFAIVLTGKRILIVEDNELNCEIAAELLSDAGFIVETALDGQIAVDMLNEHEALYYDAVLMDIQMPNMNGYEAAKMIRNFKETEKSMVPIIAMTANAFDEDKQNAYDAGMNAHIAKPIDSEVIIETLKHVFAKN